MLALHRSPGGGRLHVSQCQCIRFNAILQCIISSAFALTFMVTQLNAASEDPFDLDLAAESLLQDGAYKHRELQAVLTGGSRAGQMKNSPSEVIIAMNTLNNDYY